jgi:hypothetical protein
MRYPANNATIGPATIATFCVVVAELADDWVFPPGMAGKVANPPTAKQLYEGS